MAEGVNTKAADASRLRRPVVHLILLLALAVLFGGGGVRYGLANLVVQLAALAVLGANRAAAMQFLAAGPRWLIVLLACSVLLPLFQLVPLSPRIWTALPGRTPVIESLALIGSGSDGWRALTLDSGRTLVAFCGTLVPATMIIIGSTLDARDKRLLGAALGASGGIAVLAGAIQLGSGNTVLMAQDFDHNRRVLYAGFANRNSTGLFFVIAMLAWTGCWRAGGKVPAWLAVMLCSLLALATVLTQSRSAIALLIPCAIFVGFRFFRAGADLHGRSARGQGMGLALALAAVGAVASAMLFSATQNGRVAQSLARFSDTDTDRPQMWEDAAYAAGVYWPAGSGMGTFDEVFQLSESLEYVSPRRAGRAHNDWIELAIEAGPYGLALAIGWLVWITVAAWRSFGTGQGWQASAAAIGASCIAAQSLLDYPLRNQTMLCVAGLLIVMLVPTRTQGGGR